MLKRDARACLMDARISKDGAAMDDAYRTYLENRAREERERAATRPATDPAAIAHRKLAEEYERRIATGFDGRTVLS